MVPMSEPESVSKPNGKVTLRLEPQPASDGDEFDRAMTELERETARYSEQVDGR